MYTLVAGTLIGAWWMARKRPRTRVKRRESIGGMTGMNYQVDDFPEAGILVVRIPRRVTAVLERKQDGGFTVRRADGEPGAIDAIMRDFGAK